MTVVLSEKSIITTSEAKDYLKSQGLQTDDGDMIRLHINAVMGFIMKFTSRNSLKYSADAIEEIRSGNGKDWIYTREAPIKSLDEIQTYPFISNAGETITGPGTSLNNDDMWYDASKGRITLLNRLFPESRGGVKITYKAGWHDDGDAGTGEPAEGDLSALKLIALECLLRKWQRWSERRVGISSRSSDAGSTTYSQDDFPKEVLGELKRFRRALAR